MSNCMKLILLKFFLCHLVIAKDSELIFSFVVHRHGDRTPSKNDMRYSSNVKELAKLVEPYGYSQLTENGLRRSYRLGQYIRSQYNDLLETKYNDLKVYLRSTDVSRTKMTLLAALAAVYPPVVNWNENLDWTPVPYTTVPVEYDFNSPFQNCPVLKNDFNKMYNRPYKVMDKYKCELEAVSVDTEAGNITNTPLLISDAYNVLTDQISLGLNLTDSLQRVWPGIKEAANAAFDILYQKPKYWSLVSGVLLREFFDAAAKVIANQESGKPREQAMRIRIYAAHHENVYAFSKITNTNISGIPAFAAAFTLNLKREEDTGYFIVEPTFATDNNDNGFESKPLTVDGCGTPCYYDKFKALTYDYSWDYATWRQQCSKQ